MPTENYKFPADFVWGAATSSYQIEGAVSEDGKGEDIWDVFTKEDHRIFEHHTGETACDHYHRFKEDVKLMKEIGREFIVFCRHYVFLFLLCVFISKV